MPVPWTRHGPSDSIMERNDMFHPSSRQLLDPLENAWKTINSFSKMPTFQELCQNSGVFQLSRKDTCLISLCRKRLFSFKAVSPTIMCVL